jgi:hypothetical protein
MSSTTVLSCSCLEVEDHEFYQFYPVLVLSAEDHKFYHCFILFFRTDDPLHSRQEQDKTVVELMILYLKARTG